MIQIEFILADIMISGAYYEYRMPPVGPPGRDHLRLNFANLE